MISIDSIYKLKSLAKNGAFILISIVSLLLVGLVFIPKYEVQEFEKQIFSLNGFSSKYNDNPEVNQFFYSIIKNNGYLCLGTSESTSLHGENYYHYLNNDPEITKTQFSILAGAGRTCGVYIPLFLRHKADISSLKLIYYINPVYWNANLGKVDLKYWNRYNNYKLCSDIELSDTERKTYYKPVQVYMDQVGNMTKINASLEYMIRKTRKHYYADLRYLIKPTDYSSQFKFIREKNQEILPLKKYNPYNLSDHDTTKNILKSFHNERWFSPMPLQETTYRYDELKSFVRLCKMLNIEATFIIGPYNEPFIKSRKGDHLPGYKKTTDNIRQLLRDENADFIDATDISTTIGAFNDHQHHSNYGAYLIYKKIKHHINEKDSI